MSDVSVRSIESALSRHTRAVMQDNWQVLKGLTTTTFTVSLINPAGTATNPVVPNVLNASDYIGANVEFTSGINSGIVAGGAASTTGRVSASILSVVSGGSPLTTTVTLSQALPNVPNVDDGFTIYAVPANVTVNAPENLTQVGSQNVPVDDSGFARVPVTDFATEVNNATVATGQIRFVASGDERAYNTYTLYGTARIGGSLITQDIVLEDGSTLIIADGANVTIGSFS